MNRRMLPLLVVVLVSACQSHESPPPATQAARGKVTLPDGRPLAKAVVRFQSVADANLIVTGYTGEDGSFVLETVHERAKVPGAVVGEYKVTIIPALPDQVSGGPMLEPADLTETYKVEPGENDFALTYPGPS